VSAALQADEFSDVFHVLAEDELVILCQHRHTLRAQAEQLLSPRGVVQNVDSGKFNAFFRKKLFRSKATASTGLGEQDELVTCDFHRHVLSFRPANCTQRITVSGFVYVNVARANA
jgi:hypothetical protein